jgi:Dual specificity phosphatase, catalytic domain
MLVNEFLFIGSILSLLSDCSRMGISRSATVVAAYLTFRHGLTPLQAISWIRFQRSIIFPNPGFQEQLQDYYSVLQMDHGEEFGWKELSMCKELEIDKEYQKRKREKRRKMEKLRGKWKKENVEWVQCSVIGWGEDIERILQRHITSTIA